MPTHASDAPADPAELALAVYLEPLAAERSVLWLGELPEAGEVRLSRVARTLRVIGSRNGGERRDRGARSRPGRVRGSAVAGALDGGPFDLVVVPDLSGASLDGPERFAELRDAVHAEGVLVVGRRAEGGDYERFYDLVSQGFPAVRLLGQGAFDGVSLVDFEAVSRAYDVTVDGSLVDPVADAPSRWIAVCSSNPTELDAYALVRVPARGPPVSVAGGAGAALEALREELAEARRETDAANEHAEALERHLAERASGLERALAELAEARASHQAALAALDAASARVAAPPVAAAPDRAGAAEAEYVALEEALRSTGRELASARAEVERRGVLVRDLVEELKEASPGRSALAAVPISEAPGSTGEGAADQSGVRDRDAVLERALEAEAARVEAFFQVDELMGKVAARDSRVASLEHAQAAFEGEVRGLRGRLSEIEEVRELAEGRLGVLGAELEVVRERERRLERELAEMREQLELQLMRGRGEPQRAARVPGLEELQASEAHLSKRVGELSGQLVAARDLSLLLEEERDASRAEMLRLTALVTSLENRFEGARLGYERRAAELRLELRDALARRTGQGAAGAQGAAVEGGAAPAQAAAPSPDAAELTVQVASLGGEIAGLRARLADREAALAARAEGPGARAAAPGGASDLDRARDDADRLRDELEELRAVESAKTIRLAEAEELLEIEAGRAMDLSSTVAARDALVTRLQMDLAEEEQHGRTFEVERARLKDEVERLRAALVAASDRVDEVDAIEARATRAEALATATAAAIAAARGERDEAEAAREVALAAGRSSLEALREARRVLAGLSADLDELRTGETAAEITAVGVEAPSAVGPQAERAEALAARVELLEREVRDRDTLLRSMTAQIEERDDRLRGLHRAEAAGDAAEAAALQADLEELRDRMSRLSDELLHERKARARAEQEASRASGRVVQEQDVRRLHEDLGEKDAQVLELLGRVTSHERELKALRDRAAEASSGLERLLGDASAGGDPGTAERLGALIRILARG